MHRGLLLSVIAAFSGLSLLHAETPEERVMKNLTLYPRETFYETKTLTPAKAKRAVETAIQELKTRITFHPDDVAILKTGDKLHEVEVRWEKIQTGQVYETMVNDKEQSQGITQKFLVRFISDSQMVTTPDGMSGRAFGYDRPTIALVTIIVVGDHYISFPAEIPCLSQAFALSAQPSGKQLDAQGRPLPSGLERR